MQDNSTSPLERTVWDIVMDARQRRELCCWLQAGIPIILPGRSRTTYTNGIPASADVADGTTGASARSRNAAGVAMTLLQPGTSTNRYAS